MAKRLTDQTPMQWLGWEVGEPSLGEIEIKVPEGKRYRIVVEPIED